MQRLTNMPMMLKKKENLGLLKLSNGLKRAAGKEQTELGAFLGKRECLEEKKIHVKWSFRLYYDLSTKHSPVSRFMNSHSLNSFKIWITEKYLSMSLGFINIGGLWFYYSTLVNICYSFCS